VYPVDHFGALTWPGSERLLARPWMRRFNALLRKVRIPLALRRPFDHHADMVSLEQANNLQLLLRGVLDNDVPGAVVELGCHTGSTTAVLTQVLHHRPQPPDFHVYDTFIGDWSAEGSVRERFQHNLGALQLPLPVIHEGDVRVTVPEELPSAIAFAHIDLGVGGDRELNRALVLHALRAIHPRLSRHGVLVLMDYHVPGLTVDGNDSNPGVRDACDEYFENKREQVMTLYGGPCSHGYIRKH
jgi:O-methyltransferase